MQVTVRQLRNIVKESIQQDQQIEESFKNKMKLIPLMAFALVTNACAQEKNPNHVRLEGFTEDEIQVIEDAADEWCEKTLEKNCLTFGEDGDSVVKLVLKTDGDPLFDNPSRVGHNKRSFKDKTSVIKLLDRRNESDWLQKLHVIVRHEMGHHFQKVQQELAPGNAISQYTNDASPYITDHDVESLSTDNFLDGIKQGI